MSYPSCMMNRTDSNEGEDMTETDDSDAQARMNRRSALIAAAKQVFDGLEPRERDVLSYGIQVADDQARTVLRMSRAAEIPRQ